MRKCLAIAFTTFLLCLGMICHIAFADVAPMSSTVIQDYSITLRSNGKAVFKVTTYYTCSSVTVQSCTLEKLSGSKWIFVKSLDCPNGASNIKFYNATNDYSSSLSNGVTYRLVVVYSADGETVTATSGKINY